jgi:hypothetical protein
MAVSENDRPKLDRLGIENVKLKLTYAGPGPQSAVLGLGPDLDMTRGDIEEWLSEQSRKAAKQQDDILWWAKAATGAAAIGVVVSAIGIGIAVAIVIAALSE